MIKYIHVKHLKGMGGQMIYRDDISNLREDIVGKEGQKIIVKGALDRKSVV